MNNMSIRLCVLAFFGQSRNRVVRTPRRSRWDVVAVCALLTFVLNIGPAHAALDSDVCTWVTQEKKCILACTWDGSKCTRGAAIDKCALVGAAGKIACATVGAALGCTWDGNKCVMKGASLTDATFKEATWGTCLPRCATTQY